MFKVNSGEPVTNTASSMVTATSAVSLTCKMPVVPVSATVLTEAALVSTL